jgi:hypothetical protein
VARRLRDFTEMLPYFHGLVRRFYAVSRGASASFGHKKASAERYSFNPFASAHESGMRKSGLRFFAQSRSTLFETITFDEVGSIRSNLIVI